MAFIAICYMFIDLFALQHLADIFWTADHTKIYSPV